MFNAQTIYEKSMNGARAGYFTGEDVTGDLPMRRTTPARLAEVSEPTLMRHYTKLSTYNYSIDTGMYPLGSCTMKHNPRIHERVAGMSGFSRLHPLQDPLLAQGALQVMYELQGFLAEISGLTETTLMPAAGAHGEICGLMLMRAYHNDHTDVHPTHVLIPDTAHGTNPASVTMAGYQTVSVKTDERGGMDLADLAEKITKHSIVGLMLTNPNTLGLYDENIETITAMVHEAGGLLYYDGANLNAIMGRARPGDMGFDIVHFNVHKSFSTPHGGGGPGAGPVSVREDLVKYLPPGVARFDGTEYSLSTWQGSSIGNIKQFWGNFGVLLRAYCYIRSLGPGGIKDVADIAVLNANYLLAKLRPVFDPLYGRTCMHEFVISAKDIQNKTGLRAFDISKRLIDYGFHPPTMYFPLLIDEALMIEPTETETRETLDKFARALIKVVSECHENPELVKNAPQNAPVRRLNEARAARDLILRYTYD